MCRTLCKCPQLARVRHKRTDQNPPDRVGRTVRSGRAGRDHWRTLPQRRTSGSLSPMTYMTVFNVADHPFRNWWFPAFGLIFVAIGSGLVFRPAFFKLASPFGIQRSRMFRWFFFLFGCFWTISVAAVVTTDTWGAISALDSGQFEVVEGRVENFKPMPWQGHSDETFDVNGVRFAYSDYQVSAGFNRYSSHGGPIKEGLPVRIAYKNGEILRLEVSR